MSEFSVMLLCTAGAGACIGAGALAASVERIHPQWLETEFRHSVIAFGGGVLVAAVALVLVPEGNHYVASPLVAMLAFLGGGVVFFAVERYLGLKKQETPQLMAMILDYVPESLALGGMFVIDAPAAPLLAAMIGLQNLPEGFNAYRELVSKDKSNSRRLLVYLFLMALLGPLCGAIGWLYGADHQVFLGGVMLFASGGILYLLFQDIAPQSRLDRHWAPALGAVLGFSVGILGERLAGGG